MIKASQLNNKSVFELDGKLYRTISTSSSHVGRGGATISVELRDLRSGSTTNRTFRPDVRLQDVRLETRDVEYLYNDGALYYFMDQETYEQSPIAVDTLGDLVQYLKANLALGIAFHETEAIEIVLPPHVELKVTYTEPGVQGNTAQGATKPAETETGLTVQVPLFVDIGDTIRVDTEKGKYITRV